MKTRAFTTIALGAILKPAAPGAIDGKRTFKLRGFARWAKKEGLSDAALLRSATEMRRGLIDARLGGGVCKKRIGLLGRGKRGGVRTLVAFQDGKHTFFMFGFAKNEREDIDRQELEGLKTYAHRLLGLRDGDLDALLKLCELFEVN